MRDDDLVLRMLMDLDTNPALKKINNLTKVLNDKVGKDFSKIKFNKQNIKDAFSWTEDKGVTDKSKGTSIFTGIIRDGKQAVEAVVEVYRETNKLKRIVSVKPVTSTKLASAFGLEKSNYDGTAYNKYVEEKRKAFETAEKLRQKELQRETRFHQEVGKIIANYEMRTIQESQGLRMEQGRYEFDSALGISKSKVEQIKDTIRSLKNEISSLREEYAQTKMDGGDVTDVLQQATDAQKALRDAEKQLKKAGSTGSKFLQRVKSYGLLRIIRSVFVGIRQGFQQGIQGLVAFDKEANKTMSSISSSTQKIFGGLTLSVMPLLEMFAPILETISNVVADVGNAISRASAESKGMTTYTKINRDYLKDSANEANKLLTSFDKFESLNAKESPFVTGNVEEDKEEGMLGQTKSLLIEISGILAVIGSLKIITWLQDGGLDTIKKGIGKIKDGLGGVKDKLTGISSTATIVSSAFAFVFAIINLINVIQNWDSASLVTKITAITSAVLGLASVIFAIISAIPGIGHAKVLKSIALGLTAGTILSGAVSAMAFEKGGMVPNGTLFYAGENGKSEIVAQMPSGQTGVTNIAQFKEAMVEALYEASDVFQTEQGGFAIYLDGAEIARSKNFKKEINRTNSGLNLK